MCIIITKPAGINLPFKSTLKNCFKNNPDGCGYAYASGGRVYIKKGFFNFNHFYKSITADVLPDTPAVIHFRITTHGGTSAGLTHPFVLASDLDDLKQTRAAASLAIAHNGIISLTSAAKKGSDTTAFISEYLTLILEHDGANLKSLHVRKLIEKLGGCSRFAFLTKDGHIHTLGAGWVAAFGCMFSNNSYKKTNDFACYYYDDDDDGVAWWTNYLKKNGG